jgi:tetratricopeptide (TPR) repeat protein
LAGYESSVVNVTNSAAVDLGTIILRRVADVEGTTVSVTSLEAPKNAKKAYQKGIKALQKSKWDEGETQFQKAVDIYPKFAAAWFELGRALEQQNKFDEARKAHAEAIAADAKFVSPYLQLAGLAAREGKWREVVDTTNHIVKLNPINFPGAYFFNSVANYNLRNLDAADKSAREGLKIDTRHQFPKIDHILGVILAEKGDLPAAAKHMRSYLKLVPDAADADAVKRQLAEIERLTGPTRAESQPPPPQ